MTDKRARAANFSSEEKVYCLNLIKKYKNIIESKETGVTSWKQKEQIWKNIEREFNAQSTVFRSADVLKRFFNNKKKETRKIAATIKTDLQATGGGPSSSSVINVNDPIYDLTLDILNKKTVFGLTNKYDSDVDNEIVEFNQLNEDSGNSNVAANTEETIIIQMATDENKENDIEGTPSTSFAEIDWNAGASAILQTPVHPKLKAKIQGATVRKSPKEWINKRTLNTKTENVALKYEEVAEMKKEVLELQLQILKMQKNNIEIEEERKKNQYDMKCKRDEEEFQLRRKAALLDIKIKEEQLKALQSFDTK